jgi:hypothetical protein
LMFAFLAFAIDLGYIMLVRTQLQSSADSAALAATSNLLESHFLTPSPTTATTQTLAKATARTYAGSNWAAGATVGLGDADITIGRLDLSVKGNTTLTFSDPTRYNAVQVRVRRTSEQNGEVPTAFARVLGIPMSATQAIALAVYSDNLLGFHAPKPGTTNLQILPIVLDKPTWDQLIAGNATDSWKWNESSKQVTAGQDGVKEANLYPEGTGAPGNRGTIRIGHDSNSTHVISQQIRDGLSSHDMGGLDAEIVLGENGTTSLPGDPGMSNGIKDDLASIIGQERVVPLFTGISGNGGNAQYTIVQFVGVRVMAVQLTGNPSTRYVMVQPAAISIGNGIPGSDDNQTSQFLYSKNVWLVR